MSRHYSRSDIEVDRYDDRRTSYAPRASSRYDDRQSREEIDIKRSSTHFAPTREREASDARGPAFLREDYGRSTAGPMVLRAREREDIEYAPRPRRRSPSPEQKTEREEIIIRTDERSQSRGPPRRERDTSVDREEIIIRRSDRESAAPPPRPREPEQSRDREEIIIRTSDRERDPPPRRHREPEQSRDREEIIIRREDREREPRRPPPPQEVSRDREEIIIRRDETDSRSRFDDDIGARRSQRAAPSRGDFDRSEIIIRRDEVDDDRSSRVGSRRYADDYALARPVSHERARSRHRSHSSDSQEEIIIRRDERSGRNGDTERQEIIIRRTSRSSSPAESVRTAPRPAPAPEPQVVYAPQIHQEVITHHRHIDHGYELALAKRPVSRPPSPPSPPPPAPRQRDRSRSQERIEIRRTGERNGRTYDEDIIIDRNEGARSVPPPDTRYSDQITYSTELTRPRPMEPAPLPEPAGTIGPRYGRQRDPRDGLWTEVTKDLVIKEAIQEMGYEYEETDDFYYIFKYMNYEDMARLVGLSEDIKKDRMKRIKEIQWESRVQPPPMLESPRERLAIEGPSSPARSDRDRFSRDDERYIEREIVYRGGRPPPPPGWRRY